MVKSMTKAGSFLALALNTNTQENDTSKCYICNNNKKKTKKSPNKKRASEQN